jgi:hypothetical protein
VRVRVRLPGSLPRLKKNMSSPALNTEQPSTDSNTAKQNAAPSGAHLRTTALNIKYAEYALTCAQLEQIKGRSDKCTTAIFHALTELSWLQCNFGFD